MESSKGVFFVAQLKLELVEFPKLAGNGALTGVEVAAIWSDLERLNST